MEGQGRDPGAADAMHVDYKRFNTFLADYAHGISRGEMFIGTTAPREVGTLFTLALHVPQLHTPLLLQGKVLWTTPLDRASDTQPAGMGVQFVNDPSQKQALSEVITRVTREQLGDRIAEWLLGDCEPRDTDP